MNENKILICSEDTEPIDLVLNCKALEAVICSSVISDFEKKYYSNMFCMLYHLEAIEKAFEIETDTMEKDFIIYRMEKLLTRSKLEYSNLFNKYIIYSSKNTEYFSINNKVEDIRKEGLYNVSSDIKLFSTKKEAEEELTIKKLDPKLFKAIKINKITEDKNFNINEDIESLVSGFSLFDDIGNNFLNLISSNNVRVI